MDSKIEHLKNEIGKVNWAQYETAYSKTGENIPDYLVDLFCDDKERILKATHMLWCSLCHQHAYVSSSALPSYDFLKYALLNLDDCIKKELLDIFYGFAICTTENNDYRLSDKPWVSHLREKLTKDIEVFRNFICNSDEDISYFAERICECLEDSVK